jgi:high-affinity iron transporter
MKKILLFLILFFSLQTQANNNTQTIVHLLTYLSQDYSSAVVEGKVVSEDEFHEQIEFTEELIKLANSESAFPTEIKSSLLELKKLVEQKTDAGQVAKIALDIKSKVIQIFKIQTHPSSWPSIKNGKKIYEKNCISCHGATGLGDGPDAKGLEPAPRSFYDTERMDLISPFQAFNTVSLGIEGTAMVAFKDLTEPERWDVAFYVLSLRHLNLSKEKNNDFNLVEVSSKSDSELLAKLTDLPVKSKNARVSYLRSLDTESKEDVVFFIGKLNNLLDESLDFYGKGEFEKSEKSALLAYLEGVEPIEKFITGTNLHPQIENSMKNLRNGIKSRLPYNDISGLISDSKNTAIEIQKNLEGSKLMPFWLSFGVVFREAMESLLFIISIVTIIRKANIKGAEKWVHGGWIFSIILGIVGYIILDKTFSISGAHIEKMEGFVSLLAAVILLYVGVWFQRQSHMKKWLNLINQKVSTSISGGNLIGLASISFLVVFREVFETMLFVKILLLQYNALFLVLSGILVAIVITLIIGMAFLKVSAKIPLKPFFNISSILILVLVLMLISKGVLAFQKTGLFSSTQILNSSLEVIIPQLLVLGIGIYTLFFNKKN